MLIKARMFGIIFTKIKVYSRKYHNLDFMVILMDKLLSNHQNQNPTLFI